MDRYTKTRITGKQGRILRVVYAALSAASSIGIAVAAGSLMIRNPREAAIICGCIAIIAITRLDIMARESDHDKGKGPDRQ